uniref:Clusterin-associated protein 1 n=1 Tax=Trichobilharzia regenti TaxID=157069 RepID=A0AA85IWH9_TRIRE|nr:unnamed protein product [Trichobilharzia regenti]
MSFREMRLFTEMMRSLGYPRVISMENFRTPNFPLVTQILRWLVERYDSYADLPSSLDTEQDRVLFIKVVTHIVSSKACIRLNSKKLYQADGFAVRELMKITKVLYEALQDSINDLTDDQSVLNISETFDVAKIKQLQEARSLCSQLASCGASLHSLLNKEKDLKELRDSSLRRQLDSEYVEKSLTAAKNSIKSQTEKTQSSLINIAADEANLDLKIEKKRGELERNRKRLATLQSVRPAYMEEYEQLEEELSSLYAIYLTRFRNLAFLENQYEYFLNNVGQVNEDSEITLKNIADQMKMSSLRDGGNQKTVLNSGYDRTLKIDTLNLKPASGANNFGYDLADDDDDDDDDVGDDDDDDDDDVEEEDEEENDFNNGQDDGDENDDDLVVNGDLFRNKGEKGIPKPGTVRNQLAPGWSPSSGQRVSGANYHGRTQGSYNNEDTNGYRPNGAGYHSTKRSQKENSPVTNLGDEENQHFMNSNECGYERNSMLKDRTGDQTATGKQTYLKNTNQPAESGGVV